MKKAILLIVITLVAFSCKKENKASTEGKDTQTISGEFILIDNAGVLKGKDFIYGVVIDEKANELNAKIKPLQREEYDMVPVVVEGVVKKNESEGWPEVVEIVEIVKVSAPTSDLPTKIKTSDAAQSTPTEAAAEVK